MRLLSARDSAKRDWLQSFLGGELQQICAWDFHDLSAHVTTQSADTLKLHKLVAKLAAMQDKTSQRFSLAESELRVMEDEAAGYAQERETASAEMQSNEAQIEELKALIKIKRAEVREKDRVLGEVSE